MIILNITYGQKSYYKAKGFLPIAAGGGRGDITCDNIGENIAYKNNIYGELTAVYWAWKNLHDIDIIGMSHYRRYLIPILDMWGRLIPFTKTYYEITWENFNKLSYSLKSFEKLFKNDNIDFVLAKRWHFDGLSIKKQFLQHHPYPEDLELARTCLLKIHPESVDVWDNFLQGSDAYCCCLFICRWNHFDHLCNWVFPVLFEIEKNLDFGKYDCYQQRIIAYIYERLLNVYLIYFKYSIKETPFYFINDEADKSIRRQDFGAKIWNLVRKSKQKLYEMERKANKKG